MLDCGAAVMMGAWVPPWSGATPRVSSLPKARPEKRACPPAERSEAVETLAAPEPLGSTHRVRIPSLAAYTFAKIKSGEPESGQMYAASIHLRDAPTVTEGGTLVTVNEGLRETLNLLGPLAAAGDVVFVTYGQAARIWAAEMDRVYSQPGSDTRSVSVNGPAAVPASARSPTPSTTT